MNKIRHVITTELGLDYLDGSETFESLEVDSLHLVSICAGIEEMFAQPAHLVIYDEVKPETGMTVLEFEKAVLEILT